MKRTRQNKILELIEKYEIDTQTTLQERLKEAGFDVTQTTVSRDIKEMKLVKGLTERGTYKYVMPNLRQESPSPVLNSTLAAAITRLEVSDNIIVLRTLPGMANALASCVDGLALPEILGSVAGDDTILFVVRAGEASHVREKLLSVFEKK